MPWYRHYPRLPIKNYSGNQTYFITLCCHNRRPHFTNSAAGLTTLEILGQTTRKHRFLLHAYCLMPDHFHFLVEGQDEKSELTELVQLFKQRSAYYQRLSTPYQLWQKPVLRSHPSQLRVDAFSRVLYLDESGPFRALHQRS